jgi:hypothetical protein
LKQVQDPGGFAAVPGGLRLGEHLGLFAAFGRFLGRAGLLTRLCLGGRNGRATLRNTGLFIGFRRVARGCGCGWGGAGFFCNRRRHFLFSLSGDYRVHDMNHSEAYEKQPKSERSRKRRWNGDAGRQMSVGVI